MAPSGVRTRSSTQYKRQLFQSDTSSSSSSSSPIERTSSITSSTRRTRTQYKKKPQETKKKSPSSSSMTKTKELTCNSTTTSTQKLSKKIHDNDNDKDTVVQDVCLTPRGKKHRIPETLSCPPAPMKKRKVVSNCSSQRSPIPFFTNPEIELFFVFAVHDISV